MMHKLLDRLETGLGTEHDLSQLLGLIQHRVTHGLMTVDLGKNLEKYAKSIELLEI